MSRPSSPAAEPPPLEIDDLLVKILLRLPPLPSSLPRASAVCKRWRGLVCDPRFVRRFRFRIRHRRNPPLLGCFARTLGSVYFEPALEAPNRFPPDRFSLPIDACDSFVPLGCRHGLMLTLHSSRKQLLVWDPVTGDQHRLDIPPGFVTEENLIGATVLRAGEGHHFQFQVVMVGNSDLHHTQVVARVYSSDTGLWGDLISKSLPSEVPMSDLYPRKPAVMAGGSLYWKLVGNFVGILEFDLVRQCLAMTEVPVQGPIGPARHNTREILAEGDDLCYLFATGVGFRVELWKRKKVSDGVASWVLGRTVDLAKLLSLKSQTLRKRPFVIGYAEDNHVILVWTSIGVFTVQLESLQFKKLSESYNSYQYYPFEGVYAAAMGIGGGNNGAELLHNM